MESPELPPSSTSPASDEFDFPMALHDSRTRTPTVLPAYYTPPPRDLLSTLPPELLRRIFHFVQDGMWSEQMRGGICRALLPYTRQNYFSLIYLTFHQDILRFIDRLLRTPSPFATHPLSLVESFTISIHTLADGYDESHLDMPWETKDVVELFRLLTRVRDIHLDQCSDLTSALLSPEIANPNELPRLESLRIDFRPKRLAANHWDYHHTFSGVRHFPNLKSLHLQYRRDATEEYYRDSDSDRSSWSDTSDIEEKEDEEEEDKHPPPCLSVQELTFSGDFSMNLDSGDDLCSFLFNFPNLRSLSISDSGINVNFSEVFRLPIPSLEHLDIGRGLSEYRDKDDDDKLEDNFVDVIPSIPNFVSLRIGNDILGGASAVKALRKLESLETIHFDGDHLGISYDAARTLLNVDTRPPHLRKINFRLFTGNEGHSFHEMGSHPYDDSGWYPPGWNEDFGPEEAKWFLEEAKEAGVTVSGDLELALENHQKIFERMMEMERLGATGTPAGRGGKWWLVRR